MTRIVFGGGESVRVGETVRDTLVRLSAAASGEAVSAQTEGGSATVSGWAIFMTEAGEPVYVQPGAVAYVRA